MSKKYLLFGIIILFAMLLSSVTVLAKDNSIYFTSTAPSGYIHTDLFDQNSQTNSSLVNDGSLPKEQLYQSLLDNMSQSNSSTSNQGVTGYPYLNPTTDVGSVLPNTVSDYQQIWEPWQTKAAIRVMITSPDKQFLIVGTGYLMGNSIKVYRYNDQLHQYVHVTDLGDGIIHSDVISLAWGDTDHNGFPEIIAGSADGHTYIFEQTAIYDPKTNLENNFQLVWTGPSTGQVWGVALADTDLDSTPDVITGSWDGTVRWYEYSSHSGYPFSTDHWIDYTQKFIATLPNHDKVSSIQTGDIDGNGLPDVVIGTWTGGVYIYENNGTVLTVANGQKFPIAQDNSYRLIYSNTQQFWNPITRIVKGNLDTDRADEFGFLIPGQGTFTLDYDNNSGQFFFNKLIKDVLPAPNYELGANGKKLNDRTVDFATNTYADWIDYGYNIWGPANNGTYIPEPLDVTKSTYNFGDAPYNTALAQKPDGNYTMFKPLGAGDNATAIVDFGFGQEVTGDGRLTDGTSLAGYDLQIMMNSTPNINQWDLSISPDNVSWYPIKHSDMTNGGFHNGRYYLLADTDPALNQNKSLYYRYLKMVFLGSIARSQSNRAYVDSVNSTTLARALTQATSIGIAHIDTSYFNLLLNTGSSEQDRIITGTSDGKLYVHQYDAAAGQVKMVYDFYGGAAGDRFNLGTNIWDIVQVKNSGTLPTWFGLNDAHNETINFNTNPYFTGNFYSETYAHLNALELVNPAVFSRPNQDLVVTNDKGHTFLFAAGSSKSDPANTQFFFSQVNSYYDSIQQPVSLAFGDTNGDNYSDFMVAATWNQVVANPLSPSSTTQASIHLWSSKRVGSTFLPFTGNIDLTALETTGSLKTALKNTQAKPGITLVDLDGDGDLDIVLTLGRVYVIWNIANYMVWQLDANYFSNINANMAGRLYYAPSALDIDLDGDMDLIFSYALTGEKPRYGAVLWRNDGVTNGKTVWTLDKGLFVNPSNQTNLAFNNYTSFSFSMDYKTGKILNMTAYSDKLNALVGFQADYNSHDNFMVATYPLIYRVEINLRDSTLFKNFGYRIAETWSTAPELNHWTQTIQTSDLNHDGKGEVVVGDYDNNMYIFEYTSASMNNSIAFYKIAYKSPNLVQHQTLTQSPYASDQLPGLNGNFTRTIWRNAKFLMAGTDLNNNGRQEVVVTAGLAFYIFELDPVQGVDQYKLIYMQDLSNSLFMPLLGKYKEFTALGGGVDTNYDGRGEIMLAVGPALFIFEYAGNGGFQEIYSGYPALGGRYFSVGNPIFANILNDYIYKNLDITSIAVGDVNNNNYQDIVVGGYYQEPYGRLDGSLTILEDKLGTIAPVYEFSQRVMRDAPINDIKIADQDYDRNLELLVANDKGVDIWEYTPNTNHNFVFTLVGQISSSMNHPEPTVNWLTTLYSQPDKTILGRTQDLIVVKTSIFAQGANGGLGEYLNPGYLIEVASVGGRLVMAYSKNDGKTWKFIINEQYPSVFLTGPLPSPTSAFAVPPHIEYDPSIIQLPNGNIAITFMVAYYLGTGIKVEVRSLQFIARNQDFGPSSFPINASLTDVLASPTVFVDPHAGTQDSEFSIAYLDSTTHHVFVAHGNETDVTRVSLDASLVTTSTQIPTSIFGKGDKSENATYFADRIDVAYYSLTDQYIMAFSGRIYNESKPDVDIFTSVATNDSLIPLYTSRVSSSSAQDRFPSISVLQDQHSYGIVLVYEEDGIDPGNRIMASHSADIGRTWTPPEPMNRLPDYLVNICFTQLGLGCFMFIVSDPSLVSGANPSLHPDLNYADTFMYDVVQTAQRQNDFRQKTDIQPAGLQFYWVTSIVTERPAIAGRSTGGFAYSFATSVYIGNFELLLRVILDAMSKLQKSQTVINYAHLDQVQVQSKYTVQYQGLDQIKYQEVNVPTLSYKLSFSTQNLEALQASSIVEQTLVIGKISTISIGINPSSEFIKFTLGKALQIDTGDTDGDGRKEIVIASDRGVFLSELSHTSATSQIYDPIWQKTNYNFSIHDVALGDTNGNGFDEIYVAGEQGNVFGYEMSNTALQTTHFQFTTFVNNSQSGFTNQPVPTPSAESFIKTVDINQDGVLDLVYPSMHNDLTQVQKIYAIDGKTGNPLWTTNLTSFSDKITAMNLYDFYGSGIQDVIVGTTLGYVYVLNSHTGAILLILQGGGHISPVNKIIVGHFDSTTTNSFVIISGYSLYLLDPDNSSTRNGVAPGTNPGYFSDFVAVNVKGNGYSQILAVTTHGIAVVYDFSNAGNLAIVYILNNQTFGHIGNSPTYTDYITSVAKYNIDNDPEDEMFVAINSTIYAFDNDGSQLWNKTDLKMSQNLDKLTVVHSNTLQKNLLTVVSYPELINFEDYTGLADYIYNNYSRLGVTFGPSSWAYFNLTSSSPSYYTNATHSGDYIVYAVGQDNGYIEFNQSQQYVSFYLTNEFADSVRVVGLDESNKTVYVSNYYNIGINQLVSITLDSPTLKRIVFEGLSGFSNQHLIIDDLKFGGTNIFAFDPATGQEIWHYEYVPTQAMSFNPNVDSNGNLLDDIVPISYVIDDSFSPAVDNEQGFLGLNIETGRPDFMNAVDGFPTFSAVSLGQGYYAFMIYNQYAFNNNHYTVTIFARINSTYTTILPYTVQNDANWQLNTHKFFTHMVVGQLDTDPEQEMIVYNNRLIAAIDNNGNFLWKFVTAVNINQILLAKLDNSGVDKILVLLQDNTILTLDPTFGIQLSSQTVPFFTPVKMLVEDLFNNGTYYLIVGETNSGNTAGLVLGLRYNPGTDNFTLAMFSTVYLGKFLDILPMDISGAGYTTGFLLYLDSEIVVVNQTLKSVTHVNGLIDAVTVGDYNGDNKTDFAYILQNTSTYLIVQDSQLNILSQTQIQKGVFLAPGMKVLYSVDLTGDGLPDIVQHVFGNGYALYNVTDKNAPELAYWQERAFLSIVLTNMDIDSDGKTELILSNERLVYALKYQPYTHQFYTEWSSPLSTVPVLLAQQITLTSNYYQPQLVFLNMFGQIFAVNGTFNPSTTVKYDLRFNYQSEKTSIRSIDTLSWKTTELPSYMFDIVDQHMSMIQLGRNTIPQQLAPSTKADQTSIGNIELVVVFTGSFALGIAAVVVTRKRIIKKQPTTKLLTDEPEKTVTGGNEL